MTVPKKKSPKKRTIRKKTTVTKRKAARKRTTTKPPAKRSYAISKRGAWTHSEVKFLRENYWRLTARSIAKGLKRSLSSVRSKVRSLGLTKDQSRRLALFGGSKKVTKALRRRSKLRKAAKKKVARKKSGRSTGTGAGDKIR